MANKKAAHKPRSPVTGKVFESFVEELRADPMFGEAIATRVEAALLPGQTINSANLQEALLPAKEEGSE